MGRGPASSKGRVTALTVIGHLKAEHRMDRNYLKGRDGDRINAVLAVAGYNFSLLLRWLEARTPLACPIRRALPIRAARCRSRVRLSALVLHDDYEDEFEIVWMTDPLMRGILKLS
jgi:hypothetical protein